MANTVAMGLTLISGTDKNSIISIKKGDWPIANITTGSSRLCVLTAGILKMRNNEWASRQPLVTTRLTKPDVHDTNATKKSLRQGLKIFQIQSHILAGMKVKNEDNLPKNDGNLLQMLLN